MTVKVRQFSGKQGDFGQEIENFLQANSTFTIARKDQIVFEDTTTDPPVFRPALLVTFATLDDPIFSSDRPAMPASVPPTLPGQPTQAVPNASETVCGLVKVTADAPTPGDCPTVLSENDPRVATLSRVLGFGATIIANNTSVEVFAGFRNPRDRLTVEGFIQDNDDGAVWSQDGGTAPGAAAMRFKRTGSGNEFKLEIENRTGSDITMEWTVIARDPTGL